MAFNWTSLIPGVGETYEHVATLGIASAAVIGMGVAARKSLGTGDTAVIPANKFSLRGVFEMVTEMIVALADMVIGHQGRRFVPMFAAIFFFILVNNFLGMVPGMTPATENLNTTFAFGIFMFLAYNSFGLREQGVFKYFKHFAGPPLPYLWMAIPIGALMFCIELVSHFVRPFSLGLRLGNVMMGDHVVLSVFLDLVPAVVPVPFYFLGMFVCFVQALVFTLLSMVYVAFAVAHDEEHH
jgi:F-type H+-transporting ATPase subunit a